MTLTQEQQAIIDAAAALLAEHSSSGNVRKIMAGDGFDASLWAQLAELGYCGIHVPEQHDGLGLGMLELCLVAEELGRRLACVPWMESVVLAGTLLRELPAESNVGRWLPGIADGSVIATVAMDAPAVLQGRHVGDGWRLNGHVPQLAAASTASLLLLCAHDEHGETLLFAVPRVSAGLHVQALRVHDATRPCAAVKLDDVVLPAEALLARGAGLDAVLSKVRQLAAIALAAEQVGVARQCLELSVDYAAQRVQFGQPIAAFQAVKHRCAQMMVSVELARSAVHGAANAIDEAPDGDAGQRLLAAAMARCQATAASQFCAQEAIQLHGGAGFTWEFDPQLYFKRAQADSQLLGMPGVWLSEVAAHLQDAAVLAAPVPAGLQAEVAQWMAAHLQGDFAALRGISGPGDETYSVDLAKRWEQCMAEGGWNGIGWPAEHGGRDFTLEQQVAFHEAYVRAGGPGRLGHIGEQLMAPTLMAFGTKEQQQRFLPGILAGTTYWAQGYSEPNAGSDLANVQTRARLEGERWVITGQKVWTSWARESDWIFVLVRTDPQSRRHHGLSLLLVPLAQPGITIRPIRQMTGSAEFNEVFFDDAVTDASLHLGPVGQGWKVALALLGFERGVSTLGQQAQFEHEMQLLLDHARAHGSGPDAAVPQRIAESLLGLRALRCNALRVLAGSANSREALISKYTWSNWRRDFGRLAADVLGPRADVIDDDTAAERLRQVWLSSRADTIYAGSNEIQLNQIAERGLGMPRAPAP
jgi:alkylation response protein AidB-like acyl-CoA dehydrogenase